MNIKQMTRDLELYGTVKAKVDLLQVSLEMAFSDGLKSSTVDDMPKAKTISKKVEYAVIKNCDKSRADLERDLEHELNCYGEFLIFTENLISHLEQQDQKFIMEFCLKKIEFDDEIFKIVAKLIEFKHKRLHLKRKIVSKPKPIQQQKEFQKYSKVYKQEEPTELKPAENDTSWDEYKSNDDPERPYLKVRPYTRTTNILIIQMLSEGYSYGHIADFLYRDKEGLIAHYREFQQTEEYITLLEKHKRPKKEVAR